MKISVKLLVTLSLIFIIGCSGIRIIKSPSVPKPKEDESLIYFYRPSSLFASALTFKIIYNNQIIGALNSCDLPPGKVDTKESNGAPLKCEMDW